MCLPSVCACPQMPGEGVRPPGAVITAGEKADVSLGTEFRSSAGILSARNL